MDINKDKEILNKILNRLNKLNNKDTKVDK